MRFIWGLALALLGAGAAVAGDVQHTRGEYRFSVGADPAFAETKPLPAAWDPKAPGATGSAWRVWRFDEQVDRRGGRNHVYVDYAYEAQAPSLLGSAGRYQILFNPEYQQLTIHQVELRRDGKWLDRLAPERISLARREEDFEEDMANGNVTALIVLEDIRVNDVVRIRYSILGSNPILADQLMDGNAFGWGEPVLWSRLRVLHDPGTQIDVRRAPGAPDARIRNSSDASMVTLEASGISAYPDQGSYPLWFQRSPVVHVAKRRQWSDVVAWALPLYPKAGPLPADLEQQLAVWSKLPDADAKVKAALRTVQDQVRYFGAEMGENTHRPTPPSETWARRYGDCKDKVYLLTTLLERMGIQAVPALVSTRQGRGIADLPPSAAAFDHVIVRAEAGGKTMWLDPTITSEGGNPTESDASLYGVALPVVGGVSGLEVIAEPARSIKSVTVNERYEAANNGREAILSVETVYQGRAADHMRRSLSGSRNDEVERRYAEYYRKRFGDVAVLAKPSVKDDREANRLSVEEKYLLKSPFETAGRNRVLEVFAESIGEAATFPDAIERSAPLYVGMPAVYRHSVQVAMPPRWTVAFRDEANAFRSDAFDYSRQLTVKDREVQLVHEMQVRKRDVTTDKVAAHLSELRKVREHLSARLTLQMPESDDRKARDERLRALLKDVGETD